MTQVDTPTYGVPAVPVIDAGSVSRLAIVGDVHGNAVALEAVLDELRRGLPELIVVNGDLSWGAEPEATLALTDELDRVVFIRGNAESALLAGASSDTGEWMLERHGPARLAQIEGFAGAVGVEVEGLGRVFVCHGSPRGDQELVTQETPDERMGALLDGVETDVLVTAHVHLQFSRSVLGITSMNAGSVGLPYGDSPAAYWAELGPGIALRRTPYDVAKAVRRVHASRIPSAHTVAALLQQPPSAEEIVEHAERLETSD